MGWLCLRLVTATQITTMPTMITTTVATTGTTMSKFSHRGNPGNSESEFFGSVPIGGAKVSVEISKGF